MSEPGAQAGSAENRARRDLKFTKLEEIYQDAEMLHDRGYEMAGQWNLSQACGHVGDWMRFPMDGFPKASLPVRGILWVMKILIGKSTLRKILAEGKMKEKTPTMPATVRGPDGDEAIEVERLRETVVRLISWKDDYYPSPVFGPMDRDTVVKLQLIHAAHHLSFLIPNEEAS